MSSSRRAATRRRSRRSPAHSARRSAGVCARPASATAPRFACFGRRAVALAFGLAGVATRRPAGAWKRRRLVERHELAWLDEIDLRAIRLAPVDPQRLLAHRPADTAARDVALVILPVPPPPEIAAPCHPAARG